MVGVAIVGRQAKHYRKTQLRQPSSEDDVPDPFSAGMRRVAGVCHAWMAVVDLEELFAANAHQILGRQTEPHIRMVQVNDHRLTRFLTLFEHGSDVVLNRVVNAPPLHGWDQLHEVAGVEVDGGLFESVADLFALDEQKLAGIVQLVGDFLERSQANFQFAALGRTLINKLREFCFQLVESLATCSVENLSMLAKPLLRLLRNWKHGQDEQIAKTDSASSSRVGQATASNLFPQV